MGTRTSSWNLSSLEQRSPQWQENVTNLCVCFNAPVNGTGNRCEVWYIRYLPGQSNPGVETFKSVSNSGWRGIRLQGGNRKVPTLQLKPGIGKWDADETEAIVGVAGRPKLAWLAANKVIGAVLGLGTAFWDWTTRLSDGPWDGILMRGDGAGFFGVTNADCAISSFPGPVCPRCPLAWADGSQISGRNASKSCWCERPDGRGRPLSRISSGNNTRDKSWGGKFRRKPLMKSFS